MFPVECSLNLILGEIFKMARKQGSTKTQIGKIAKALIFGTIFFIVGLIFTLMVLNVGAMLFQHQDAFTIISEFNHQRIEISQQYEGASSMLLSDNTFYTFLGIVLFSMWCFSCYNWYPSEGRI